MAKPELKPYRLISGTHRVPNPDFVQDKSEPEESHVIAKEGDIVYLSDEQFKSFSAKFRPVDSNATDVKDTTQEELAAAKVAAAKTGTNIDPNKPIAPQVAGATKPATTTAT